MNNTYVAYVYVYVAWKRKMLHDVGLHDGIGGHQAYILRTIYIFMAHQILHLAKTTCSPRDTRARRDYKLALLAAFGRSLSENKTKCYSK